MNEIKLITFDAGGTLLYPYPSVGAIYHEVMNKHNIHISIEDLDLGFKRSWKATQNRPLSTSEEEEKKFWYDMVEDTISEHGSFDNFDIMFDDLWTSFAGANRWHLYDRAKETLNSLKHLGYKIAILSNWDSRLRHILEEFQIDTLFDEIYISAEVGISKPAKEIFELVMNDFSLSAQEILHIGDSEPHDIRGSAQVGWQSLLIDHDDHHPDNKNRITCLSDITKDPRIAR